MFWYFTQLLVQLVLAFLLGLLVGWLLWARTLRKRTQLYVRETRGLRSEIQGFALPRPQRADRTDGLSAQRVGDRRSTTRRLHSHSRWPRRG